MNPISRAAGELLDTELFDPVDLGGSARSTVLRCRTAAGDSVIVKSGCCWGRSPENGTSLRCRDIPPSETGKPADRKTTSDRMPYTRGG
ncbi:hypothetical protein GCM10010404_77910 [Nonomuraea africana]|uniref:Uncharacterized protein n=1 Tax=Nonomuraea africana TaxID=46171 RepID=A0ABR9KEE0_9ACTN|nr:hypothetical protein [Nonomuraea africana]